MSDKTQSDWVKQVLGIDVDAGGAAVPRPKLMPIWTDAKETVDASISRLQQALRGYDDDDLNQIAEYGLFGATTGETVKLMAALRTADSTPGDEPLDDLRDAVKAYRDFLEGAPIVDLIEENPFGVKVPMRRTLGAALNELERLAA